MFRNWVKQLCLSPRKLARKIMWFRNLCVFGCKWPLETTSETLIYGGKSLHRRAVLNHPIDRDVQPVLLSSTEYNRGAVNNRLHVVNFHGVLIAGHISWTADETETV